MNLINNLFIEATNSTPLIDFKEGILLIKGQSYSENPMLFYQPIINWLKNYFNVYEGETIVSLDLIYYNTSSAKFIVSIFDIFENANNNNQNIILNWYYDEENINILESGQDFKEEVTFEFNIISY